jgi:hypothetical protein
MQQYGVRLYHKVRLWYGLDMLNRYYSDTVFQIVPIHPGKADSISVRMLKPVVFFSHDDVPKIKKQTRVVIQLFNMLWIQKKEYKI